jgi:hypothetical protein
MKTKGAFGSAGYTSKAKPYKHFPDAMSPSTPRMKDVYDGAPRRKDNTLKLRATRKLKKWLEKT